MPRAISTTDVENMLPDIFDGNKNQISTGYKNEIYKCSADTRIFIDTVFLREAYAIGYRESISRVPIFGYDSIYFDFVLEGRSMVSGVLLINLIKPGQLFDILGKLGYSPKPERIFTQEKINSSTINDINAYYQAIKDYSFGVEEEESKQTVTAPAKFNIQIMHGNLDDKVTMPSITLIEDVWIIENSVMPTSPDAPLIEKYQFIAKRITTT